MFKYCFRLIASGGLLLLLSATVHSQHVVYQDANRIVWRIDSPEVRQPRTDYPMIQFRPYDEVIVEAGGCVQTGGAGRTWKRYVNPRGRASDRLYHGKIFIPGATAGMVRISSITRPYQEQPLRLVVNKLPPHYDGSPLFLQLGYEDENYGDNGYWGHDNGNPTQCRYQDDGGNAWVVITIIHHDSSTAPPSPAPRAPLDLWWTEVDDNFLPLNPRWWHHVVTGSPPYAQQMCGGFHNENDSLPAGKSLSCTLWDPWVNERSTFSLCWPSSNTVAGHINWAAATYTGRIYFRDYSGSDGDYNLGLVRDDLNGVSLPTDVNYEGKPSLLLEFDSKETVDVIDGTGTWWDRLHRAVDAGGNQAQNMVRGQDAIVIGLLGLDNTHDAKTELHPVYGLAIHLEDTPDGDMWAVMARNRGNEGACSQQDELLALRNNRMSIFFPRPPHTTISPAPSNLYRNHPAIGHSTRILRDGVLLTVQLPPPELRRRLFWGDFRLKKEKADLTASVTASPDPVVTGSLLTYTVTVTNNGPDTSRYITVTDGVHTRTVTALAAGASRTFTWSDTVDCALADGAAVSNTVRVSSLTQDTNPDNNSAAVQVTASNPPPVFTSVPPNVTAYTGPGATECGTVVSDADIGTPTVTDNCPGVVVSRSGVPAGNFFPVGVTTITYTATDSGGATATAAQTVTVIDDTPPVIVAPPVTAYTGQDPGQASPHCGVVVTDASLGAVITDNCPGVTYTRTGVPPNNFFPVGVTQVTYVATDAHGNTTAHVQPVTVIDNTPPVIAGLALDTPVLWPPDHRMRFVTVNYEVTDNCPLPPNPCALSASSNEPVSGTGPGDLAPDWRISDAHHLLLRAERAGSGAERVYTVVDFCTDNHGNTAEGHVNAVVPLTEPLIQPGETATVNAVENLLIENLPNTGRDFTSYVSIVPGVVGTAAHPIRHEGVTIAPPPFTFGGSAGIGNEVTIDGGESLDGAGRIRTTLSPEAVQEVIVRRNSFQAEFGFTTGAHVEFVTKSGTNNLHGSGYLFYQPQRTAARNFFNFGPAGSAERQFAPGFTLSGPFVKGKLYFFTGYEHFGSEESQFRDFTNGPPLGPTPAQAELLNALEASGDANARRIAANLRSALTTTPETYPLTFRLLRNNSGSFEAGDDWDSWTSRIDYEPGHSDSLRGRFTFARRSASGVGRPNHTGLSGLSDVAARDYTAVAAWTHEHDVDLVNRLLFQASPRSSVRLSPRDGRGASVVVPGFGAFGRPTDAPSSTVQDRFQLDETLTWIRANHTPKFGASYRAVRYEARNEFWFSGEWRFSPGAVPVTAAVPAADRPAFLAATGAMTLPTLNGLQSLNLGVPSLYRQSFGDPLWKGRAQHLGLFAQDTWKAHPRLTVDYGGRVDYYAEPSPLPHNSYFSPRLGFAWSITGDHKTLLRGGGGLYYAPLNYQVAYLTYTLSGGGQLVNQILKAPADVSQSPAALWNAGLAAGRLPFAALSEADLLRLGLSPGRGATGRVIFQLDRDFDNPYSVQASLGLQRQIDDGLGVALTYQTYLGRNLPLLAETNYLESAEPNPLGAAFGPLYRRIDPTIAQLNTFRSVGSSAHHGLTLSMTKSFRDRFQFQAHYTLSKSTDDLVGLGSGLEAAFPTRLNLERGLSAFDSRHNFVASGVFASPFVNPDGRGFFVGVLADVTLSPIIYLRSGNPFTPLAGADTNGDTHPDDRLFFIGRSTGVGPDFKSFDLRVTKILRLNHDGTLRLQLVAEGQNLFNRTNFAALNDILGTDLNSPDYALATFRLGGHPDRHRTQPLGFTDAFHGRRVQFGVKFIF